MIWVVESVGCCECAPPFKESQRSYYRLEAIVPLGEMMVVLQYVEHHCLHLGWIIVGILYVLEYHLQSNNTIQYK